MSEIKARIIQCRRCGKETVFSPENPYRPFCSERCKTIDLGDWASENYRVPSEDSGSIQDALMGEEDEEDGHFET